MPRLGPASLAVLFKACIDGELPVEEARALLHEELGLNKRALSLVLKALESSGLAIVEDGVVRPTQQGELVCRMARRYAGTDGCGFLPDAAMYMDSIAPRGIPKGLLSILTVLNLDQADPKASLKRYGFARTGAQATVIVTSAVNRGYIERDGRRYKPTELGEKLLDAIGAVYQAVAKPCRTLTPIL